ncbi:hypothetical protein [Bifidobacterium callitrichidarum]|uniref:Uncharacterized protein n=1 Tax=Bifidobacterium callitrichidarum TaxID=2052941 RepID=A0A2U2NC81_9BIFI|nr:hypothetical protein [Bifidobacterium callitrichidarum]PWG66755.1 hypothetical protein DF196_02300 [Bifidobacterium callitrichidarum]
MNINTARNILDLTLTLLATLSLYLMTTSGAGWNTLFLILSTVLGTTAIMHHYGERMAKYFNDDPEWVD